MKHEKHQRIKKDNSEDPRGQENTGRRFFTWTVYPRDLKKE